MKKIFAIAFITLLASQVQAQGDNPKYDKALADSMGGDLFGMKKYVLVLLKTGEGKVDNKTKQDSIFRGHLNNIRRLAEEGKMVVAGPMGDNKNKYEGIFILNVKTTDEAKALLATDPAVQAKLLDPELYQWYGSAALPLYLKYHDKVMKKSF